MMTLEMRRHRNDLIEVFKIIHGYEGLDKETFFEMETNDRTRGHSLKIHKKRSRLNIRKFTFSQRIVEDWNNLTEETVNAPSLNSFKRHLGKLLKNSAEQSISLRRLPAPVTRIPLED